MSSRTTLVSVDLDDLACYHAIHGLEPPSLEQQGIVLERCLPRYLELFADLSVRATFFVIGRDLARDLEAGGRGAALLRRALADGHELANHSYAHAYDLVRWSKVRIVEDLQACDRLLRELGAHVVGFRAPGYTHNVSLLGQVATLGYRYDSSALPSLPYYLAKLGVIAWMAVRGRHSQSMARGWRSFVGSCQPRYMARLRLWEVPMSVSPYLHLPLIGTMLLAGPEPLAGVLRGVAARQPYCHLELHGLDLADPGDEHDPGDGYAPELLTRQPELQVPLTLRTERLRTLLETRGNARPIASFVQS
jgi:hypothetical protein